MSDKKGEHRLNMVLIEWDGVAPPMKWYRQLERLGIRTAGRTSTKKVAEAEMERLSVLARRARSGKPSEDAGITFQEGCILCSSASLAKAVALYAREVIGDMLEESGEPRPTVLLAFDVVVDNLFTASKQDAQILNRIQTVTSKGGRPPALETYVVTCMEEMESYQVDKPKGRVLNCPNCRGLHIHYRNGVERSFKDDPAADVLEMWLRTRFAGPHWEPCLLDGNTLPPPVEELFVAGKEGDVVQMIQSSQDFLTIVRDIAQHKGRQQAFDLLDAVLVGRSAHTKERRSKSRIAVMTSYFQLGGSPIGISLHESPLVDLADAGLMLNDRTVCDLMLQYQGVGK